MTSRRPNPSWPLGFSAIGLNADVSFKKSRKDLALFYSHLPAAGAAVFTQNRVKAAPVRITQERLLRTRGKARAIVINAGSANAATGKDGYRDAIAASAFVEKGLAIPGDEVWLASTGVIGVRIKIDNYGKGVRKAIAAVLKAPVERGDLAAEAIMTTDTRPKTASAVVEIRGVPVRLWGCAKGAGMIHPVLEGPRGPLHATMLSVILTDARVRANVLQRALEQVADKTYNCVSIDGDTSTNDFVGLLANGASGAPEIAHATGKSYAAFRAGLFDIAEALTTEIALDGEGASRLVHVEVQGARSEQAARRMAAVVASSPLVKTACHGADPNWGRVLMALGRSGVPFDPDKVRIWIGEFLVCRGGQEIPFPEKRVIDYMRGKAIVIRVDLGLGRRASRYKTCDFTGQYVGINAGYRT